jgi:hypothetical protein
MGQAMRMQNARLGRPAVGVAGPPNLTGDPRGYDTRKFPNARAIRRALAELGYQVPINDQPLRDSTAVRRFQEDYNVAAATPPGLFDASATLQVTGSMDKHTINALDHVLPYVLDWRTHFRPKPLHHTPVNWGKDYKGYRFSGCSRNRCYPGMAVMGCGCGCKGGGCGGGYRFSYERAGEGTYIEPHPVASRPYRFSNGTPSQPPPIPPPYPPKPPKGSTSGGMPENVIIHQAKRPQSGRLGPFQQLAIAPGGYAARRQRALRKG